jgi:hypothetical protein
MSQQINLFKTLPKLPRYYLTEQLLFQIIGGLVLLLVIISFLQGIFLERTKREFTALQESYRYRQSVFTRESALTGRLNVENINREIHDKTLLLQKLQDRKVTFGQCSLLSHYFTSLGEMPVSGLWFNQINIDLSKDEIALAGMMYEPVLLFQLIQNLDKTSCFSHREFGPISLTQPAVKTSEANLLAFTMTSKTAGT